MGREATKGNLWQYKNGGKHPSQHQDPATNWVKDRLEDEAWHDYQELARELIAANLPMKFYNDPRNTGKLGSLTPERRNLRAARYHIGQIARRKGYEIERETTGDTRRIKRIRKDPNWRPYMNYRSCSRCGVYPLSRYDRVRRVITYILPGRYPAKGQKFQGDVQGAKFPTEYLCLKCADEELHAKGVSWRIEPREYLAKVKASDFDPNRPPMMKSS